MINQRIYYCLLFLVTCYAACSKKDHGLTEVGKDFETSVPVLTPVTAFVNNCIGGFYQALPAKYNTGTKKYPLLVFLHGGGQFGNGQLDLPLLLNEGTVQLLYEKIFPPDFLVNGEHYSFVILAPQFRREPSNEEVRSFITYASSHYRVDSSRIYLAGLSNGGKITCNVAADYPSLFAAIVAMSGVSDSTNLAEKSSHLANANMPIWAFHNEGDMLISIESVKRFISLVESFHPVIVPRFTISKNTGAFNHDAWTRATNPGYKEQNKNIYEWMLQFHR